VTNPLDENIPSKEYKAVDPFTALAEPTRRRIVAELRHSARTVNELAETLAIGQPSVSKHLKVLREAQFVSCRGDAQRRIYTLEAAPFKAMEEWLEPYRKLWSEHLDALERHLDRKHKEHKR
jgi:DNA-binding transcriptional ArsR family regulator